MSIFLRLLNKSDKGEALMAACTHLRQGYEDSCCFDVEPNSFNAVPGKPFAYWVSTSIRELFEKITTFEGEKFSARQGLATGDDFRFVRLWWEEPGKEWIGYAKGGAYSRFYADIYLLVKWANCGAELNAFLGSVIRNQIFYFRPGLTWSRRTTSRISLRVMPVGCIFGDKGPAAFESDGSIDELLSTLALTNSHAFSILIELQLAAADAAARSYEVGVIQRTPFPQVNVEQKQSLAKLVRRAWSLKHKADSTTETSHAFVLPAALRVYLGDYKQPIIEEELSVIQAKIDDIAFMLYGFCEADRTAVQNGQELNTSVADASADNNEAEGSVSVDKTVDLLSWAVGVVFGRFDWRLATGKRQVSPEPEPFDPLPAKSPGMLPDYAEPFHHHNGILLDDQGHQHDLPRLIEEVLITVDAPVPDNLRHRLQKDFFAFHLQRYSKSRRKAPIYWPLSTASGSYTLWIYYPFLTSQTLFTAVNDFLDGPNGKLTLVSRECAELRLKGSSRSSEDEKQYEMLQTFEQELTDLRDTLLKIAPTYQPNHDDGVQITAAPLWPLFRHKPWQKVLKDTWTKLEKGDYDWAHLAMNYWPERVREKCKTDKSLAIAHGLESLYVEPEVEPKKTRGKKKAEIDK